MTYFLRVLVAFLLSVIVSACTATKQKGSQGSSLQVAGADSPVSDYPFVVALTFATRQDQSGTIQLVAEPEKSCVKDTEMNSIEEVTTSFYWDEKKCHRHVFCTGSLYLRPDGAPPVRLLTGAHCILPQLNSQFLRLSVGANAERLLASYPTDLVPHPKDRPEPVAERFHFDIAKSDLSTQKLPVDIKPIPLADPLLSLTMPENLSDRILIDVMLWRESQNIAVSGRSPKSSLARLAEVMPRIEVAAYGVTDEGLAEAERDEGKLRSLKGMILTLDGFSSKTELAVLPLSIDEGICSGDSGGPILIRKSADSRQSDDIRIVGVIASGLKHSCRGTLAKAANVLPHVGWLTEATP